MGESFSAAIMPPPLVIALSDDSVCSSLRTHSSGFAYSINLSCAIVGSALGQIGLMRTFHDHAELESEILARVPKEEAIRAARSARDKISAFVEVTGDQASSLQLLSDE
jgi:hypothetical protein